MAGKAIVMFEGRHQFEELPVLRRRGKQKEKGYRHKVKKKNFQIIFLDLGREEERAKCYIFEIQVTSFGIVGYL